MKIFVEEFLFYVAVICFVLGTANYIWEKFQ
jgi:hypothetical protein